jgi:hypothetical protein
MWDTGLDALEQKSTLLDRVSRMIDRLQRSIRQITRELQRMQAFRAKEEGKRIAREIAARRYSTKQSQSPPDLERFQADRDTLEE